MLDGTVDVYKIFGIPFMSKHKKGLTIRQLQEWEAMDKMDPIGKWRDDLNFASLSTLITNIAIRWGAKKGENPKLVTISDFMPNWLGEEKPEKVQSVEEMKSVILSLVNTQNKKVGNQPKRKPKN